MRYNLQGARKTAGEEARAFRGLMLCRPHGDGPTLIDTRMSAEVSVLAGRDAARMERDEAHTLLEEIGAFHLTLAVNLGGLERALEQVAYDPSTYAAASRVEERVRDLFDLRDALEGVHVASERAELAVLFLRDEPLAEYLRGLQAWCLGLVRALEELTNQLRVPAPDWAMLRHRVDESMLFYLPELETPIGAALAHLRTRRPTAAAAARWLEHELERLFRVAQRLSLRVQERFG